MRYGKSVKRRDKLTSNSTQNSGEQANSQRSKPASNLLESDISSHNQNNFNTPSFKDQMPPRIQVCKQNTTYANRVDDISETIKDGTEANARVWFEQEPQPQHIMNPCEAGNSAKPQYDMIENSSISAYQPIQDPDQHKSGPRLQGNSTDYSAASISLKRFGSHVEQEVSPSSRIVKNSSSLNDDQGRQQNQFDNIVVVNEFKTSDCSHHQPAEQQSLRRDNVPNDGILCDLPNYAPIKLELSFNGTSQNHHENIDGNLVSDTSKPVGDGSRLGNLINQEVKKSAVSQLEELYQFETDYFYRAGLEGDLLCHLGLQQNIDTTEEFKLHRDGPRSVVNNGNSEVERNKSTNGRLSEQKSTLLKQQSMLAAVNNNINNNNNNNDDNSKSNALKPTKNDNMGHPSLDRKEESCQGYANQNETDDRLKQLSLRFSADANKKTLVPLNTEDPTRGNQGENSVSESGKIVTSFSDSSQKALKRTQDYDEKSVAIGCKFDIYSFELDSVIKTNDQVEQDDKSLFNGIQGNKNTEVDLKKPSPVNNIAQDSSIQSYDESSLNASEDLFSNQTEINDLIEQISSAHRDTCTLLKAKILGIGKRQSISSLPNIAGSQYCRYRNSSLIHSGEQRHSENSQSSSLLNGSAGSSASSVSSSSSSSGGSPMNNNQYITSSPTLSPTSKSSATAKSHSNGIAPYLESSASIPSSSSSSSVPATVASQDIGSTIMKLPESSIKQDTSNELTSQAEVIEEYKISLWQEYALLVNPSIKQVVEFAKQVPGFLALNQLDQLLLIKSGFFEIWLVTIAGMFNCADSTLTFADGTYIDKEQLDTMFDKNFSTIAFNFSISFNQLCLDDTEIGLVSAIILLQPSK